MKALRYLIRWDIWSERIVPCKREFENLTDLIKFCMRFHAHLAYQRIMGNPSTVGNEESNHMFIQSVLFLKFWATLRVEKIAPRELSFAKTCKQLKNELNSVNNRRSWMHISLDCKIYSKDFEFANDIGWNPQLRS